MMPARHGLSLSLILALFCAQLLFAWHAPAHIDAQPHPWGWVSTLLFLLLWMAVAVRETCGN